MFYPVICLKAGNINADNLTTAPSNTTHITQSHSSFLSSLSVYISFLSIFIFPSLYLFLSYLFLSFPISLCLLSLSLSLRCLNNNIYLFITMNIIYICISITRLYPSSSIGSDKQGNNAVQRTHGFTSQILSQRIFIVLTNTVYE